MKVTNDVVVTDFATILEQQSVSILNSDAKSIIAQAFSVFVDQMSQGKDVKFIAGKEPYNAHYSSLFSLTRSFVEALQDVVASVIDRSNDQNELFVAIDK